MRFPSGGYGAERGFPGDGPGVLDLFLHLDGGQPFLAELRVFHLREGGDFSGCPKSPETSRARNVNNFICRISGEWLD